MNQGGGTSGGKPPQEVEVLITCPKTALRKGERAMVRVAIAGLAGIRDPVVIRLENRTPGVIRLHGGNIRRITLRPEHVSRGGTVLRQVRIEALAAGPFAIASSLEATLAAHLAEATESWGSHAEEESSSWFGDGHKLKTTEDWKKEPHDYAETRKWIGHNHELAMTAYGLKDHHSFEDTREWRGQFHPTDETKVQEKDGHAFARSVKKEWFMHVVQFSKLWEEKDHEMAVTQNWNRDRHEIEATREEGWKGEDFYYHTYERTRAWSGDHHGYSHSKRWEKPGSRHEYAPSKADGAGEREKWERDHHEEKYSAMWWKKDHAYHSSIAERDGWKDQDHKIELSEEWRGRDHAFGKSRKEKAK